MNICHLRYRTSSNVIATSWAAIHRSVGPQKFHALGCQPDPEDPALPIIRAVTGSTPTAAYAALMQATGRPWWIAIPERDLLEIPSSLWRSFVRATPRIQMVSEVLWNRAELMWDHAATEPDIARGLWLSLTAAHADELRLVPGP